MHLPQIGVMSDVEEMVTADPAMVAEAEVTPASIVAAVENATTIPALVDDPLPLLAEATDHPRPDEVVPLVATLHLCLLPTKTTVK